MMRDIDTTVQLYEQTDYTDTEGNHFSVMEPAEDGWWVSFADHDRLVMSLESRIVYLQNVCDEQVRMLTGD